MEARACSSAVPIFKNQRKVTTSAQLFLKKKFSRDQPFPNLFVTPPKAWIYLNWRFVIWVCFSCFHTHSLRPHSKGPALLALVLLMGSCLFPIKKSLSSLPPAAQTSVKSPPCKRRTKIQASACHQGSEQFKCSLPEKSCCRRLLPADPVSDSSS